MHVQDNPLSLLSFQSTPLHLLCLFNYCLQAYTPNFPTPSHLGPWLLLYDETLIWCIGVDYTRLVPFNSHQIQEWTVREQFPVHSLGSLYLKTIKWSVGGREGGGGGHLAGI